MILSTGCERIEGLWTSELDDSASAMSRQWDVVSRSVAENDCETLEPVDDDVDQVRVEIIGAEPDGTDDPAEGPDDHAKLDIYRCQADACTPIATRYSLFDRAQELGWEFDEYKAGWSRYPACISRRVQAEFVPLPEDRARIEVKRSLGESIVEGEADCDREFARERRDELTCNYREVFELRRPADPSS